MSQQFDSTNNILRTVTEVKDKNSLFCMLREELKMLVVDYTFNSNTEKWPNMFCFKAN